MALGVAAGCRAAATDLRTVFLWLSVLSTACSASTIGREELEFGFHADLIEGARQTLVLDEDVTRRLDEVGQRVAGAADQRGIQYRVRVVNDPLVNAYAAAGGFVYVNTGLLDLLEAEDELASVLAHEMAHSNRGHQLGFLRASHRRRVAGAAIGTLAGAAVLAAGVAAGVAVAGANPAGATYGPPPPAQQLGNQLVSLGGELAVPVAAASARTFSIATITGYGKKQELEADRLALRYLRTAGYDPNALIRVFDRLIVLRSRLGAAAGSYMSSLVNADPGLEERKRHASEEVGRLVGAR